MFHYFSVSLQDELVI